MYNINQPAYNEPRLGNEQIYQVSGLTVSSNIKYTFSYNSELYKPSRKCYY